VPDTKSANPETTIGGMRFIAAFGGLFGTLVLLAPFH
jgi:hypothetical protein